MDKKEKSGGSSEFSQITLFFLAPVILIAVCFVLFPLAIRLGAFFDRLSGGPVVTAPTYSL